MASSVTFLGQAFNHKFPVFPFISVTKRKYLQTSQKANEITSAFVF